MLHTTTLNEIQTNKNPGVEYEIALFYKLLSINPSEQSLVQKAFMSRLDYSKIKHIASFSPINQIIHELQLRGLTLNDVSLETQNDNVGPADVVMYCSKKDGSPKMIGLSVKYANTCTLNVTGRKFITNKQIENLKQEYIKIYLPAFIQDMSNRFGNAANWHRKTSPVTDKMIDKIRDAVIQNWPNVKDKAKLLTILFHSNSPIEFWVIKYDKNGYSLKTTPSTIDIDWANYVRVEKHQTSYIAFYLENTRVAHMQVKFNNGFIESNIRHNGSRKKQNPDFIRDGLEFVHGQPFGSWNFCVED